MTSWCLQAVVYKDPLLAITRRPQWEWATLVADIGGQVLLIRECRLPGAELGGRNDRQGSSELVRGSQILTDTNTSQD